MLNQKHKYMKHTIAERNMIHKDACIQFESINQHTQRHKLPLKQVVDIILKGEGLISEQREFIYSLLKLLTQH